METRHVGVKSLSSAEPRAYSGSVTRASPVPYQGLAAAILAQWREVERAKSDPALGPEAMVDLQAEADRLRDEYQSLVRQAINEHRPEPPPFPKD
jgi:hypothetical protein